jgi:succinoglycan biosynthesis protein ExoL
MGALKILVLAHDLSDDAVRKRVAMLSAGGAAVTVAGFRRTQAPIDRVAGCAAINFGRTYDAAFGQRMWSVSRQVLLLRRHRALFADADVIVARSLEMLAIAVRGQSMRKPAPAIVYESLDIHRLLLRRDIVGAAMRVLEGLLARKASALITSSPAFVSNYFDVRSKVHLPIRLVENKVLTTSDDMPEAFSLAARQPGPPWIIGWFGNIRCGKSLEILTDVVRQNAGRVEVIIRGRPAFDQFKDFHKSVAQTPGLRFLGAYKNPDDLVSMYRGVHFTWAIDLFEHGLNSAWLLPNRLYEGGLFGSVPIAAESVETGRFLQRLGIGVILKEPLGSSLSAFLDGLTPERYRVLEAAAFRVPKATWVCGREDCVALVQYMRSLTGLQPAAVATR